jgi:hypothetical protein
MTHTPGPWHSGGMTVYADKPCDLLGVAWKEVATGRCPASNWSDQESHANVRLIAAAPELLAALRTAVRVMQDNNLDEALGGEFDIFTDAIAKAEGRTT